jgi:transposase
MKRAGPSKPHGNAPGVRTRRTFSEEYKREALALARQRRREQVSWAQIGRELDVRPTLLFQWAQQLEGDGRPRDALSATGLPGETLEAENRRLRRENAILREERAFAKKAAAFFAKESL